jgi:branched-chain amino acid transport system substrate-binding protein
MGKEEKKINRREYLKYVGAGVAGVAIGGVAGYLTAPGKIEKITETITKTETATAATVTKTVTGPGTTVTITSYPTVTPTQLPKGKPLIFGASLPLTGVGSIEGPMYKMAYELWRDYVNEKFGGIIVEDEGKIRPIKIIIYDDESKAERDTVLYEKLATEDNVDFFLGPYGTDAALAAAPICEKYKIPVICAATATPSVWMRGYNYIYQAIPPSPNWMQPIVWELKKLEPPIEKIAVVHADHLFATTIMDAAVKTIEKAEMDLVLKEAFPSDAKDLSPLMTKLKSLNPDAVLVGGWAAHCILVAQEAKRFKVNAKIWAHTIGPGMSKDFDALGDAAENHVGFVYWWQSLPWSCPVFGSAQNYYNEFIKKYGEWLGMPCASGGAVGVIFQLAIEKYARSADREKVKEALDKFNEFIFFGREEFSKDPKTHGLNISMGGFYVQNQGGKPYLVLPSIFAEKSLVYPKPQW